MQIPSAGDECCLSALGDALSAVAVPRASVLILVSHRNNAQAFALFARLDWDMSHPNGTRCSSDVSSLKASIMAAATVIFRFCSCCSPILPALAACSAAAGPADVISGNWTV